MSLNCLSCHALQRTDSYDGRRSGSARKRPTNRSRGSFKQLCGLKLERNWSGPIPQPYEPIRPPQSPAIEKVKKAHRRLNSTGSMFKEGDNEEPRLVRSSGMRRDWSFEKLQDEHRNVIELEA